MSATSPIRASQRTNCLAVSICLLGLALGVPLGLSSSGTRGKLPTLGLGSRVGCAEARVVLRDCAQAISAHPAGTTAQNIFAAVNVMVVLGLTNDGTSVAIINVYGGKGICS